MDVEDISIMLKTSKDEIRYNMNTQHLYAIRVYHNEIQIILNRFENAEGKMVEEATVYPISSIEYYTYIEVAE